MIHISKEGLLACVVGSLEHSYEIGVDYQDLETFTKILGNNIRQADVKRESLLVTDFYEIDEDRIELKDYSRRRDGGLVVDYPDPAKDTNEKWILTYTYFDNKFRLSWLLLGWGNPGNTFIQSRVDEQMAIIKQSFDTNGLKEEFNQIMSETIKQFKESYYQKNNEEMSNKKILCKKGGVYYGKISK